eukprot:Tbor_TRINITY_DN6034_c3_g2::TRINITY_DN6034_c3_g2_i13::g.11007::m.11007
MATSDKDKIAALCSPAGNLLGEGAVGTGDVKGFGTNTLTITFSAPAAEVPTKSYMICVPYCFKASSCESGTISWALVNSDNLISFLPANPSVYTFKPNPPQAGTSTEITFTGTDLDQRDKIRIIPQGKVCSSEPTPLANVEYKADVTVSIDGTSSVSSIRFNGVVIPVQVCYSRDNRNLMDDSNIWAPVFQTTGDKPKEGTKGNKGSKPDTIPNPDVKKSSNKSATAISSTIPAVLITSVVFLYLYNW